jgi:hypothetical protein
MENLEKKIPVQYFNKCTGKIEQEIYDDFLNFLDLKNLKKGDVFYECYFKSGKNYELKLKENPVLLKNGIECIVETLNGDEVDIYISGDTEYKHLNLFKVPQNLTKIDDKKFVYIIS